jgi:hypothetical protein
MIVLIVDTDDGPLMALAKLEMVPIDRATAVEGPGRA